MKNKKGNLLLETITEHLISYQRRPGSYTRTYYWWKKLCNIEDLFKREIENKKGLIKVADIGCGLGANIFCLKRSYGKSRNLEFYGVDLSPSRIYFCNLKKEKYEENKINFSIGNAEKLDFPDNNFDIIIYQEVLEHLKNLDKALNEFFRILKPCGIAIISTPNETNLVLRVKK